MYRDYGWSVIPIRRRDKRPAITWEPFTHEPPPLKRLKSWWPNDHDALNLGVVTGAVSNIAVLDLDPAHFDEDSRTIEQWIEEYPTPLIQRSGGGGAHLFYSIPPGEMIKTQAGIFPGVDVRGEHGIIVAAPSIHQNGKTYTWTKGALDFMCGDVLLPPFPIDIVKDDKIEEVDGRQKNRWIVDALDHCDKGLRNVTASRLVGYFISQGVPKDIVSATLHAWNKGLAHPLPSRELDLTVRSIEHKREDAPAGFHLDSLTDFMTQYGDEQTRWTIDDWLPSETICFVVSPPGTYKTWMLLDLAVSVASATPFLGQYPVRKSGPVIFMQQEDPRSEIASRASTIVCSRYGYVQETFTNTENGSHYIGTPPDIPLYFYTDRRFRFDDAPVMEEFTGIVRKIKPALVILDPLYSATSTDDYMAKTAEQMFVLKRLRDETGCTFVIAHHTTKKGGAEHGREGLWGSQFLNAFLETGWQLRRPDSRTDTAITVLRHFKASANAPPLNLDFEIDTSNATYIVNTSDHDVALLKGGIHTMIIDTVVSSEVPLTKSQICDRVSAHRTSVGRNLKSMVDDGMLIEKNDNYTIAGE